MASQNALALGLALLDAAGVPLRERAGALRKLAGHHRSAAQQVASIPTGAGVEAHQLAQAMQVEAETMLRAAADFDRQADAAETPPNDNPTGAPSLAQVG